MWEPEGKGPSRPKSFSNLHSHSPPTAAYLLLTGSDFEKMVSVVFMGQTGADCLSPNLAPVIISCVTSVSLSHLSRKGGIPRVPTSRGCHENPTR